MLPQIILILLSGISLGIEVQRHGEEVRAKHNAWVVGASVVVLFAILWWGGFWKPMGL